VLDPVACDVEREYRHDDAVLLGDQAGLAIDRALQESQARCPADDIEGGAGDLLAAFDRALGDRADEAAGVGDGRGAGIQEADEGRDVPGFPGLFEVPDEAGLPAGRGRGGCDARRRRRAEEASWRQAAGVRPTMPATSAKG